MDKRDIDRCYAFAKLALGRSPKPEDIAPQIEGSSSFAEFRVRWAVESSLSGSFAGVISRWRDVIPRGPGISSKSLGSVSHAVEEMMSRLCDLEAKLVQQQREMLESLKQLDNAAGAHKRLAAEVNEAREVAMSLRTRLLDLSGKTSSVPR